ncbi:hypothetical protein AAG570_005709, partial [Ranatra chinensis]
RGKRKARWKLKFHHQALPPEYLDHYEASAQQAQQAATVRYTDLPYMGEMTLDNTRPRRGRKPKKADICHLIYKNYGTTVVDEPLNLCVRDMKKPASPPVSMCKFKFTGGAQPSLQEKKVLSVDAAGHFRYYDRAAPSAPAPPDTQRRKSRKSLAREKLTQQLESAQGATYCKFRQLRKFTRYLFRSWKHHLPGELAADQYTQ